VKGGEFGPEMLTRATKKKKATPLDFKEGFGKLKEAHQHFVQKC
jgi:hypothetical protein